MADHHIHSDLGDKTPGYDQDFDYPHLDDVRIGASQEEISLINMIETEHPKGDGVIGSEMRQ